MLYSVEKVKRDVRVALDENRVSVSLLATDDIDTLSLDEIIESKITEAARIVEGTAPTEMLDAGKALSGSITFASEVGKGRGRMQLPDDFMRLLTFKMSDWERAITEPINEHDGAYRRQSSRFAGVRGNPERPVVAIVREPTGLVLEFWSCEGGAGVVLQRGRYLAYPQIVSGNIDICEKLYYAVVIYTAYLVALSTGNERADGLRTIAESLMRV